MRKFFKYPGAIALSTVITGGLLIVMQHIVMTEEASLDEPPIGDLVFLRPLVEEPIETLDRRRVEPPPPPVAPPLVNVTPVVDPNGGGNWPMPPVDPVDPDIEIGKDWGDGNILPVVMVAPEYPRGAATRGIEGWVLVEFAVDELGRVIDPTVIVSQPAGVFDRAAIKAVLRYKYKPRVVNGEPVVVRGVRQRMTFELTNA